MEREPPMKPTVDDGPLQWMMRFVADVTARSGWRADELLAWLQGEGLPPVGYEDQPYQWLLRGLPLVPEPRSAQVQFAERAAELLDRRCDVRPPRDRRAQFLYNLFLLCAGLDCPAQLARPLQEVLARQRRRREDWFTLEVRDALLAALIENQGDDALRPVWEALIDGRRDEFLPGNHYDGFDGIRLMPVPGTPPGEPDLDVLGAALKGMAERLQQEDGCRPRLHKLLQKVQMTYPGRPAWERDLLLQAHKQEWPRWAVECLPSLCIWLRASSDGTETAYVWRYIYDCIPDSAAPQVVRQLCAGDVLEVRLSEAAAASVRGNAESLEKERLTPIPYSSDAAFDGWIRTVLADLVGAATGEPEQRAAYERAYRDVGRPALKRDLVAP